MASQRLGTGADLRVLLTQRGGSHVLAELTPNTGSFSRALDKSSDATIEVTGGNCAGLGGIHAWATELCVVRDGRDAWYGPVTDVQFLPGKLTLAAADLSCWYDRRTTGTLTVKQIDASDVIGMLHEAAMREDPIPNFTVVATPSGQLVDRDFVADEDKYVSDAMDDLAKASVDWTVYGRVLLVHGQEIGELPFVTLLDEHWATPPTVHERGNEQATHIIVHGKDGLRSEVRSDPTRIAFYGLLTRVFDETSITTQADLDANAKARLEMLQDQLYIETPSGAGLAPSAPITVADLVPGLRIRVDSRASERKVVNDFRLAGMKATFDGKVTIDLQPLGSVA